MSFIGLTQRECAAGVGVDISSLLDLALNDNVQAVPVSVLRIIRAVCDEAEITQIDLCSRRQCASSSGPRQVAYWLCRKLTHASTGDIGRIFGRDHSTIMHGIKHVDRWIADKDPRGTLALRLKATLEHGR